MLFTLAGVIVHVWMVLGLSESIVEDVRGLVRDAILDSLSAKGRDLLICAKLDSDWTVTKRGLWSEIS